MISVGLVSVQRINNFLSFVKDKRIKVCDKISDVFTPVEINVYKSINPKRLYKKVKKAQSILSKRGINNFVYTSEVIRLLGMNAYKGIPLTNLLQCFGYLYDKIYTERYNTICLYDKELKLFNYENLSQIICLAKNIIIYTSDIGRALDIAESLFFEYGALLNVKEYTNKSEPSHMVIDADNKKIRVGDIVVDGLDYDVDCGKYDVDIRPLIDNLESGDFFKIKNLRSGKNLIKLVDNFM